jgi:AcrR family transcriptional regulator
MLKRAEQDRPERGQVRTRSAATPVRAVGSSRRWPGGEDIAGFSPRQQQVLTAAIDVLVAEGDRLTMTAVARKASCSKETLYKWFGDRDGLLTATVQWQAAKVRAPLVASRIDEATLRQSLEQFARDLLATISGEVSVTLNRLAAAHAGSGSGLGAIMLEHGPSAIRKRTVPVLDAGRKARLLRFTDSEDAYRTFFGLVVRDTQIRRMLGETLKTDIDKEAKAATEQFIALYGIANQA